MKPSVHIVVSAAFGTVLLLYTRSFAAAAISFVAGTLIDIDHLHGFFMWRLRHQITFREYYVHALHCRAPGGVYFAFHSLELLIICWLFFAAVPLQSPASLYALALLIGASQHLLLDQIGGSLIGNDPRFYFFVFRWMRGFDATKMKANRSAAPCV